MRSKEQSFFIYAPDPKTRQKKWFITPLFFALIMIECFDLVFAVDSIPAVFSITQNIYIVYTSNIFAVLGLRALYSVLNQTIQHISTLQMTLSVLIIFIGLKTLSKHFLPENLILNSYTSLIITIMILSVGLGIGVIKKQRLKLEMIKK